MRYTVTVWFKEKGDELTVIESANLTGGKTFHRFGMDNMQVHFDNPANAVDFWQTMIFQDFAPMQCANTGNYQMKMSRPSKEDQQPASIERSLFSVGGESPKTGKEILEVNDYDEDVRDALEVAFNQGSFVGYHMEDIKSVKKR